MTIEVALKDITVPVVALRVCRDTKDRIVGVGPPPASVNDLEMAATVVGALVTMQTSLLDAGIRRGTLVGRFALEVGAIGEARVEPEATAGFVVFKLKDVIFATDVIETGTIC